MRYIPLLAAFTFPWLLEKIIMVLIVPSTQAALAISDYQEKSLFKKKNLLWIHMYNFVKCY